MRTPPIRLHHVIPKPRHLWLGFSNKMREMQRLFINFKVITPKLNCAKISMVKGRGSGKELKNSMKAMQVTILYFWEEICSRVLISIPFKQFNLNFTPSICMYFLYLFFHSFHFFSEENLGAVAYMQLTMRIVVVCFFFFLPYLICSCWFLWICMYVLETIADFLFIHKTTMGEIL